MEIAEHEPAVLFGSNALSLGDFPKLIYVARKYADLDKELLIGILRSSEEFLSFIRKGNAFTVKEAIGDFENLEMIIRSKQEFLDEYHHMKTPSKYARRVEEKRSLFTNIASNVFDILRMVRSKIFKPEDQAVYDKLYETLSPLFGICLPPQISSEKYKHLYAAAFYLSLHQETSAALVVTGQQFEIGLKSLARRFLSMAPPYPQSSNLEQFPIKLYGLPHDNSFTFRYTTKK
ncbi:MAG: hypothetical protein Q8R04_02805 [Nanoarchaeota archaeon]|nr:hypothetical protein [Nanoarchaeota archaeon]